MQKYLNSIANKSGAPANGITVLVQNYPTGSTATIYSDNGITTVGNPLTTDINGAFSFYAADGRYQFVISGAAIGTLYVYDILLEDPADGGSAGNFSSLTIGGTLLSGSGGSSLVGYLPAETGAVATTVQAVLRETASVTRFGAVGDGISNDSAAWLAALEACRILHNSGIIPTLVVPPGKYRLTFTKGSGSTDPFALQSSKAWYSFNASVWTSLNAGIGASDRQLNIVCEGTAVLLHDGDTNSYLFASDGSGYFSLNLTGIVIRAYDNTKTIHGAAFTKMNYSTWNRVSFEDFRYGVGLNLYQCEQNEFIKPSWFYCMRGLILGQPGAVSYATINANEDRFYGSTFSYCCGNLSNDDSVIKGFLEIYYAQTPMFNGGSWKGNYGAGIIFSAENPIFSSVYFENNSQGRDQGGTVYGLWNHLVLNATASAVTDGPSTRIVNVTFLNCYMSYQGILFRASAGKQIGSVKFYDCLTTDQTSSGLNYVTGETQYIRNIEFEGGKWTDGTLATLESAWPLQALVDGTTYVVSSSSSAARLLPLTVRRGDLMKSVAANTGTPAFDARLNPAATNATGDGTAYDIVVNTVTANQNSNFNTGTGVFTAPVAGMYQFNFAFFMSGIAAGHTTGDCQIVATGRTIRAWYGNPYACSSSGVLVVTGSCCINMAVGDTAKMRVTISGSTKVISIGTDTYFSGHLI